MHALNVYIEGSLLISWIVLLVGFAILAKCADLFVESSVAIAQKFNIPKLLIGIVLVSLATTAPELSVSLISAIRGRPEMALGNAIGSVICDDGLALALAGVFSLGPIIIIPHVLKTSGLFLIGIEILAFLFIVLDHTLSRWEGGVLVALFVGYMVFLYRQHKRGKIQEDTLEEGKEFEGSPLFKLILLFSLGLAGIILSSEFIITAATTIAVSFHIPDSVIALTLVAFGTSIPEVATCIVAARKNEGALAVGNILGADIMNICWVAGASAMANDLVLGAKEMWFMFPSMFIIVGAMLLMLRHKFRLTRTKGIVLFLMYLVYLGSFLFLFPPAG